MKKVRKFISYRQVMMLLGEALFQDEFVKDLTWRERWILEETSLFGTPANGYQSEKDAPSGPLAALPEVGVARAKLAFMDWQRNQVSDWLEKRGIQVVEWNGRDVVDRAQFQTAFG